MRVPPFFSLPIRQFVVSLALAWPLLTACSSGGSDAADTANAQNAQAINNADVTEKQEADAEFLVKAASNALLEVELCGQVPAAGEGAVGRSRKNCRGHRRPALE
jgi:putative membrane protein